MNPMQELDRIFKEAGFREAKKPVQSPVVMVECEFCRGHSKRAQDNCEHCYGTREIDAQEIIESMSDMEICEGIVDVGGDKFFAAVREKTPYEIGVLVLELAAEYGMRLEMKK